MLRFSGIGARGRPWPGTRVGADGIAAREPAGGMLCEAAGGWLCELTGGGLCETGGFGGGCDSVELWDDDGGGAELFRL
jgi:hypothetical protein